MGGCCAHISQLRPQPLLSKWSPSQPTELPLGCAGWGWRSGDCPPGGGGGEGSWIPPTNDKTKKTHPLAPGCVWLCLPVAKGPQAAVWNAPALPGLQTAATDPLLRNTSRASTLGLGGGRWCRWGILSEFREWLRGMGSPGNQGCPCGLAR